jgi:hypothetical protein
VSWPTPVPGFVIRYSYLWQREAAEGREEGVKDRPCAIVLVVRRDDDDAPLVAVLPVTHSSPQNEDALEIPALVKSRLRLDAERSWIVLSEANLFRWPGPDLRPAVNGDPSTITYGMLPPALFSVIPDAPHGDTSRVKKRPRLGSK